MSMKRYATTLVAAKKYIVGWPMLAVVCTAKTGGTAMDIFAANTSFIAKLKTAIVCLCARLVLKT